MNMPEKKKSPKKSSGSYANFMQIYSNFMLMTYTVRARAKKKVTELVRRPNKLPAVSARNFLILSFGENELP